MLKKFMCTLCVTFFSFQMVEYIWYTLHEYPNLHCNDLCYLKTKQMWIHTVSYSTTVKPSVSNHQNVKPMRSLTGGGCLIMSGLDDTGSKFCLISIW